MNIIIKEVNNITKKYKKELNRFYTKYKKILVLDKLDIDLEISLSEKFKTSIKDNKMNINVNNNKDINNQLVIIKKELLLFIKEHKIMIPDYIYDEINSTYNMKEKIKQNNIETMEIINKIQEK